MKLLAQTDEIRSILERNRTVAIVGLSRDPSKDSYRVAEYLQSKGYRFIPVNPFADETLGQKCYKSLLEMPENLQATIEIVDIFRPSQDVPPIVDEAIHMREKFGNLHAIWMQLGIVNEEAAKKARGAGLTVIMDKCMMIEHKRVNEEPDPELERIRREKMEEMQRMTAEESPKESMPDSPIAVEDSNFDQLVNQYDLMIVDCWAPWCGPCLMVAPIVDELAKSYAGKVVFGKLNVDENPLTAGKFGVMSIPTLLVMKQGKEVDRMIGAAPRRVIEEKIRNLIKQ